MGEDPLPSSSVQVKITGELLKDDSFLIHYVATTTIDVLEKPRFPNQPAYIGYIEYYYQHLFAIDINNPIHKIRELYKILSGCEIHLVSHVRPGGFDLTVGERDPSAKRYRLQLERLDVKTEQTWLKVGVWLNGPSGQKGSYLNYFTTTDTLDELLKSAGRIRELLIRMMQA
jgi:hypothetical protein